MIASFRWYWNSETPARHGTSYKPENITVIVNTIENNYFSGVYVAPDVDTVIYTLAGIINEDMVRS